MASLSSSKQTKRKVQAGRRKGSHAKVSGVALPFKVGEYIKIELQYSVRELDRKQRATLKSFQLQRQGQAKVIQYRGAQTAAKLDALDNLVEVQPAKSPTRQKKRRRNSPSSHGVAGDAVNSHTYTAGGGDSRLLEIPGAGQLRVEAQTKSFALMWPSRLAVAEFFRTAAEIWWEDEGTASLVSPKGQGITEIPVSKLHETLADKAWIVIRADFADRALTWALEYRDPERAGRAVDTAVRNTHEVSLAGTHFDAGYFSQLLKATAVPPWTDLEDHLTRNAAETLAAYA